MVKEQKLTWTLSVSLSESERSSSCVISLSSSDVTGGNLASSASSELILDAFALNDDGDDRKSSVD